jgi:hypothetical protein
MSNRKKVKITLIKERINQLEEKGITELNAEELHNWTYHNHFRKQKKNFFQYLIRKPTFWTLFISWCVVGYYLAYLMK